MIRCILWRLLFEVCNIMRLFGHGPKQVKYLAFGANLSDDVLKDRKIKPFAAEYFTLRDYGLRFDHPSRWVGCGYASAEPASGESLHGVLYTLSGRDALRMDFYEIVPVLNRYRRTEIEQDGEQLFFYQTNLSTPNLKPTPEYLGFIVNGLKSHPGVTEEYRSSIAVTETAEPDTFVKTYLSRLPGHHAENLSYLSVAYLHFVQRFFLSFLYRRSLTEHFIR